MLSAISFYIMNTTLTCIALCFSQLPTHSPHAPFSAASTGPHPSPPLPPSSFHFAPPNVPHCPHPSLTSAPGSSGTTWHWPAWCLFLQSCWPAVHPSHDPPTCWGTRCSSTAPSILRTAGWHITWHQSDLTEVSVDEVTHFQNSIWLCLCFQHGVFKTANIAVVIIVIIILQWTGLNGQAVMLVCLNWWTLHRYDIYLEIWREGLTVRSVLGREWWAGLACNDQSTSLCLQAISSSVFLDIIKVPPYPSKVPRRTV